MSAEWLSRDLESANESRGYFCTALGTLSGVFLLGFCAGCL